jgi:hypothetical protein
MAWFLGYNVGYAAAVHSRGAEQAMVDDFFGKAETLATALGTGLPPLPVRSGDQAKDSAACLRYLLDQPGEQLVEHLQSEYDVRHAALFLMAVRSNALIMLYGPGGGDIAMSAMEGIESARTQAGIGAEVTAGLREQVAAGAPFEDVFVALRAMQADVEAALEAE